MGVSHDMGHTRQDGEFLRRALRITSRHDDPRSRSCPVNRTYRVACLRVGRGGYSAGIQDDDVGLIRLDEARMAPRAELHSDGLGIRRRGPAAKILNEKSRHYAITMSFRPTVSISRKVYNPVGETPAGSTGRNRSLIH